MLRIEGIAFEGDRRKHRIVQRMINDELMKCEFDEVEFSGKRLVGFLEALRPSRGRSLNNVVVLSTRIMSLHDESTSKRNDCLPSAIDQCR